MAVTSVSARRLQPNLASVQLWNQGRLVPVLRNVTLMIVAQEIRNVAPMVVVMSALSQNTKQSQDIAQQLTPIMLVSARVSAVQIATAEETRSVVGMAVVASVVLLFNKPAHVVLL